MTIDLAVLGAGPELLHFELQLPREWVTAPTGVVRPAWLRRDTAGQLVPDRDVDALIGEFVRIVSLYAPAEHAVGTVGGRIVDAPAPTPGEWHTDPGAGLRFVAVVAANPGAPGCEFLGQEFRGMRALPSNRVGVFTSAVHRSPVVWTDCRRVFLTAATYPPGVEPELSYAVLHDLARP